MNTPDTVTTTLRGGLWTDNPGLVQLLGLCPLLAVTTNFVNGLGLGLATLFVVTLSNGLVSLTRSFIRDEIRIPMYVLIIASLVTCIEMIFKAYFPFLDRSLGIFIPLIVTNCTIVARAEIFAQAGQFVVYADAKPGVDKDVLAAALDAEIAKFIAEGPTEAEIQRAKAH